MYTNKVTTVTYRKPLLRCTSTNKQSLSLANIHSHTQVHSWETQTCPGSTNVAKNSLYSHYKWQFGNQKNTVKAKKIIWPGPWQPLNWSVVVTSLVGPVFRLLHDVRSLVRAGTHLPCGYMEQLRVCLKVLCNSQEWHPSPLVSLKVLIRCGHNPSVPDPRGTLGPWLTQVHTSPVGTWNSSESASKYFATHKNGTHLHWWAWKGLVVVVRPPVFRIRAWRWVPGWRRYTPPLWVHGTAQSLTQSTLQLTTMAPISTGELEST